MVPPGVSAECGVQNFRVILMPAVPNCLLETSEQYVLITQKLLWDFNGEGRLGHCFLLGGERCEGEEFGERLVTESRRLNGLGNGCGGSIYSRQ